MADCLRAGDLHYRAYVGEPDVYDLRAASQFCLLTRLGLREWHTLLDIGCGSLRAGRLFIVYLNPENYYGVEPAKWLIQEAIRHELGEDLLDIKKPSFLYADDWSFSSFDHKFDFILAQSIFSHAALMQIRTCLLNARECMKDATILAANFRVGRDDYIGSEWVYPGLVAYTAETISRTLASCGLSWVSIDWYHPTLRWYLIAKPAGDSLLREHQKRLQEAGTVVNIARRLARRCLG